MERYRIHADAALYYLTYSVVEWLPSVRVSGEVPDRNRKPELRHRDKQLRLNAYVIMPTHLHMIVFDGGWESERLRRTLLAAKARLLA